jgi:hypothetical protein
VTSKALLMSSGAGVSRLAPATVPPSRDTDELLSNGWTQHTRYLPNGYVKRWKSKEEPGYPKEVPGGTCSAVMITEMTVLPA